MIKINFLQNSYSLQVCSPTGGLDKNMYKIKNLPKYNPLVRRKNIEVPVVLHTLQLPEESVVFHALLPKVFAVVSLIKVELNNILVVALQKNEQFNNVGKILVQTVCC
jgi:hypothetical protein